MGSEMCIRDRGEKSCLRFRIPWYSHSSSLSSFFRFPFLLSSLLCPGSSVDKEDEREDDDDDDADDEEDDDDDDDDDDEYGDGDAGGMDVNSDAADAGKSDWRDDEDGSQRGRLTAVR